MDNLLLNFETGKVIILIFRKLLKFIENKED